MSFEIACNNIEYGTWILEVRMPKEKPVVKTENAHFLKGHASWLYCDHCNQTIAYLCYVTYRYFHFSFLCLCGCKGWVENSYEEIGLNQIANGKLIRSVVNKRYCCEKDESALFSPVPKNLKLYKAQIVCASCNTKYEISEEF